uniref:Uncharacterized protein n=1 Tax=Ixodes ricinus TaxID=34613 RepID=A0A6B0V756_IXORI
MASRSALIVSTCSMRCLSRCTQEELDAVGFPEGICLSRSASEALSISMCRWCLLNLSRTVLSASLATRMISLYLFRLLRRGSLSFSEALRVQRSLNWPRSSRSESCSSCSSLSPSTRISWFLSSRTGRSLMSFWMAWMPPLALTASALSRMLGGRLQPVVSSRAAGRLRDASTPFKYCVCWRSLAISPLMISVFRTSNFCRAWLTDTGSKALKRSWPEALNLSGTGSGLASTALPMGARLLTSGTRAW